MQWMEPSVKRIRIKQLLVQLQVYFLVQVQAHFPLEALIQKLQVNIKVAPSVLYFSTLAMWLVFFNERSLPSQHL